MGQPRPQAPPPEERPGTHYLHMRIISPIFKGIRKIVITYRTLVTYTNRACLFHLNKLRTAAPGNLLLAKAISCPVSVVKADSVQGGGTTNRVRRKTSILWLQQQAFLVN